MANEFTRPHVRVDAFVVSKPYKRPKRNMGGGNVARQTEKHAEKLKRDLAAAFAEAGGILTARDGNFRGDPGRYLDFETVPNEPLPDLTWKSKGVRLASANRSPDGVARGTIYVPDSAQGFLEQKLDEYQNKRSDKTGRPAHEPRFASIEQLRAARLESLWVDRRPIPAPGEVAWWECWCWPDRVGNFELKSEAAEVFISQQRLQFTERAVIFVRGTQEQVSRIVASSDAVAELRRGRDDAYFFTSPEGREDQHGWVESALERLEDGPNKDAVAVCLLDTGINRGHPLLAPIFAQDDLHSVNPAWGTDDHDGHGSQMSGLAVYGDLTSRLPSTDSILVPFCGESVKLLPPQGFPDNEPQSYGLITQQALFRPEIAKPLRERVYCMAITQADVYGPKATSWSAALDVAAFGGDELDDLRRRLICVSAGNLPDGLPHAELEDWDAHEIEDPAHAWNVLTVGGYTDKGPISDAGFEHWQCAVEPGSLSPYSRVSAAWFRGVSAIKPELVLEAGNKGVDDFDGSMISGMDSLSLLTTNHDPIEQPLTLSWATSAATAQLAGLATTVLADDPELWPETVRALLVHSARWSPSMEATLLATLQKSDRLMMLRRFGYGVPDLSRALRSASNSLALVAQKEIQPFVREAGKGVHLNEAHFFALPWPRETLLALGEHEVRLRITLSYFVEPNPSADAPLSPGRYRSAGLRFDLRRRNEPQNHFEARVNDLALIEDGEPLGDADNARLLGERSVSAGSLHVEEWRCTAADLADRGAIAIYPVGGWWRTSADRERNGATMRYALVATIDAGETELDLWVETLVAAGLEIEQAIAT